MSHGWLLANEKEEKNASNDNNYYCENYNRADSPILANRLKTYRVFLLLVYLSCLN